MFSAEITMSLSKIPLFTSFISWIPPIFSRLSAKTEVAPGKDRSIFIYCRFDGSQRTAQELLREYKKRLRVNLPHNLKNEQNSI